MTALTSPQGTLAAPAKAHHRFSYLLLMELILIVGFPFAASSNAHTTFFQVLSVLIFSTALYAVLGRGSITVIAAALGIPGLTIYLVNAIGLLQWLRPVGIFLGVLFLAFVTGVLIWTIIADPSVTTDTLAGAVSAYLLVGITFGLAYGLTENLAPGSFRNTIEPGKVLSPPEFIFFSFVTLTTVGYGDIVPWGAHARSLVILESVTGIMYPAVLIGRLIGLHARKRSES